MSEDSNQSEHLRQLQQERRNRHLDKLIHEAFVNALAEQDMESPSQAAQQAIQNPQDSQQQSQNQQQQQQVQPSPEQSEQVSESDYTVDQMIDELNAIRGGRSFTDPEVYGRLSSYFNTLDNEAKADLDKWLTDISELVTGAADAEEDMHAHQPPEQQQQQQVPTGGSQQPSQPSGGGQSSQGSPSPQQGSQSPQGGPSSGTPAPITPS